MALRLVMAGLCMILFGPAIIHFLRGRRKLHSPDQTILVYRTWEGQ